MSKSMLVIADETRSQYAGLYVLMHMIEDEVQIPIGLGENDGRIVLKDCFEWLLERDYVTVGGDKCYQVTSMGRDVLETFRSRYREFVEQFDVFCAVDLGEGEFAFAYYHDFDDNYEWQEFLHQDRWDDLRIAIGELKGWDPAEVVFMSFIQDGRFGRDEDGYWDFERLLGSVWSEIQTICNNAIRVQDLGYEDGGEVVDGHAVIEDIYAQGQELMQNLRRSG